MAKTSMLDRFSQKAYVSVIESAANTLTFQQIRWAVGLFQGVALVLSRVEWHPDSLQTIIDESDALTCAITLRDDLTGLDPSNQAVPVRIQWQVRDTGTPAGSDLLAIPVSMDYSTLPEGGMILPANPMFIAVQGTSLATARTVRAVLHYRFKELSDQENIELLQALIPGNI